MSEAEQPIPKSDLQTRVVMGIVLIIVACAAIWFSGWPFRALVVAAATVMLLEWADMHRVPRLWAWIGAALLAVNLLAGLELHYPAAFSNPADIDPAIVHDAWLGFGICAALGLLLGLASRRATMFGGFLYVAIPSYALLVLNWISLELVFWLMLVTWATDIFAYFAGRSIGGPKLAPRISPNKTWAGLIGGMIGAEITAAIAAYLLGLGQPFMWVGGFMGLVAQGGDLYESWLKRRAGVKDSGTILPGHGGALDRLDGLLPVVMVTFLIVAASSV